MPSIYDLGLDEDYYDMVNVNDRYYRTYYSMGQFILNKLREKIKEGIPCFVRINPDGFSRYRIDLMSKLEANTYFLVEYVSCVGEVVIRYNERIIFISAEDVISIIKEGI